MSFVKYGIVLLAIIASALYVGAHMLVADPEQYSIEIEGETYTIVSGFDVVLHVGSIGDPVVLKQDYLGPRAGPFKSIDRVSENEIRIIFESHPDKFNRSGTVWLVDFLNGKFAAYGDFPLNRDGGKPQQEYERITALPALE